jgi:hypothetical protein
MWGRTHSRLRHPLSPPLRHRHLPSAHLLDGAHSCVRLVGERWYDPPPPLHLAIASTPSHSDIRAGCYNSVLAVATGCPSPSQQPPITGPNLWDPCTWPSSSSFVWLTWPPPLGPQHPSQHSCISSSAPLRGARAAPPQEGSGYTLGPIGRPSLCYYHLLRLLSLSTLSPPSNVPQK